MSLAVCGWHSVVLLLIHNKNNIEFKRKPFTRKLRERLKAKLSPRALPDGVP